MSKLTTTSSKRSLHARRMSRGKRIILWKPRRRESPRHLRAQAGGSGDSEVSQANCSENHPVLHVELPVERQSQEFDSRLLRLLLYEALISTRESIAAIFPWCWPQITQPITAQHADLQPSLSAQTRPNQHLHNGPRSAHPAFWVSNTLSTCMRSSLYSHSTVGESAIA